MVAEPLDPELLRSDLAEAGTTSAFSIRRAAGQTFVLFGEWEPSPSWEAVRRIAGRHGAVADTPRGVVWLSDLKSDPEAAEPAAAAKPTVAKTTVAKTTVPKAVLEPVEAERTAEALPAKKTRKALRKPSGGPAEA